MLLNCHSFHSLRYGTIPTETLVNQAKSLNIKSLALTDIHTISGVYDFIDACKEQGIKPLIGVEFRSNNQLAYITLAKNRYGLAEINRFLSNYYLNQTEINKQAPLFKEVFVIYPLDNVPKQLLDHERIGIRPDQITRLIQSKWHKHITEMVILHPVTFSNKKEYNLHKILRAINLNILVSKLTPNDCCMPSEIMISEKKLLDYYTDYPEIISNTETLINQCNFDQKTDSKVKKNKQHFTGNREQDLKLLRKLTMKGLQYRYGNLLQARERIEKELRVIEALNFCGYFLITWDIINYSKKCGFLHIGRGSGANSIVAYCLGITDICPLELDLYFERFLNLNRSVPPDFDIDWSWKDRDTILEYIFKKYVGHVAFCGTNVEFKARSIIREIGKVFGLPKQEIDTLVQSRKEKYEANSITQCIREYGKMLEKFPNQRSMHACGILISEEPITNYSALELPPKGFPIVQFDMHVAERLGFDKFDILSQRGIGHIDETVKLVKKNRGINVPIRDTKLSKNEPRCNQMLAEGKTLGCFYIESPAMRGLLRRLQCNNYKVLVAASSIIRPGVAQSGMMKEYIFRHNYPDRFEYFHPVFKQHLGETYGIMVYQEDVIKIALHYGGLSAADGDVLRRAMSGKGRSKNTLQKIKEDFFSSCAKQGHPETLSKEIYRQIESFAGYSFCKAHSASYAMESYMSLYLKAYFPLEFMTAVVNNFGGFYRTEVYLHEARLSGGKIHNPCINKSEWNTIIEGNNLYLGFQHLKSLEMHLAEKIIEERHKKGHFTSLENFINRIAIGIESLQILIFIGAFRFTGLSKSELLIQGRFLLSNLRLDTPLYLLQTPLKKYQLPILKRSVFEDAFDEIELLGFPISTTPFNLLQTKYRGHVRAKDLLQYHKKTIKILGYLISRKQVPTKKGDMYFGTWIDVEGNYFDTTHFADSLAQYPFKGPGCYLLLGKVDVDYHFPTITIIKMARLPFIADPRYAATDEKRFKTIENIQENISLTSRSPYPQEHEINLPRVSMKKISN